MDTIKSHTDIEQSKKLEQFLPLESADMQYIKMSEDDEPDAYRMGVLANPELIDEDDIPCWSSTALLEVIRNNGRYELQMYEGGYYFEANGFMTESYFNPVDACYELILKLYERKLL